MSKQNLILLGRFGAPHGVRGEVRLQSFTEDPLSIGAYGPLTDKTGARNFDILTVRAQGKDMLVARVKGVADRNAAEALTGVELYIDRARLPPPDEDEFYIADLVGLRAETPQGDTIGRVLGLRNFGAGDILEVAPLAGGETLMFHFTRAVVPIISVADGRVVIDAPAEIEAREDEADAD